jgi:hypothetical protein
MGVLHKPDEIEGKGPSPEGFCIPLRMLGLKYEESPSSKKEGPLACGPEVLFAFIWSFC